VLEPRKNLGECSEAPAVGGAGVSTVDSELPPDVYGILVLDELLGCVAIVPREGEALGGCGLDDLDLEREITAEHLTPELCPLSLVFLIARLDAGLRRLLSLPMEVALARDMRLASWRAPIVLLLQALEIGKERCDELWVRAIRLLVEVLAAFEEPVAERVNENAAHWRTVLVLPRPEHLASMAEIAIRALVHLAHRVHFLLWVRDLPASPIIGVRMKVVVRILAIERGQDFNLEFLELNDDHLAVPLYFCAWVARL